MHYLELTFLGIVLFYPLVDYFNEKFKSKSKNVEYLKISLFLWVLTFFLAYIYYIEELSVVKLDYLIKMGWQNIVAISFIVLAISYLVLLIKNINGYI